ncbi:MAG: cell wall hydrolase [Lachnospiraceae bacterium]|nr:cell wall hydrolase [Lachnospiraceae bacterium]
MSIRKLLFSIAELLIVSGTGCIEAQAAEAARNAQETVSTEADANQTQGEESKDTAEDTTENQKEKSKSTTEDTTEDSIEETNEEETASETDAEEAKDGETALLSIAPAEQGISETAAILVVEEEPWYTEEDLKYLTCLIYSEAGDQCYEGKLAVANVVLNRMNNQDEYMFGHADTIKDVIYDKKWGTQFSVTIGGSSSMIATALTRYETGKYPNQEEKAAMQECEKAAKAALEGENNIGDYLFFRMYNKSTANKYKNHVIIEDHIFYNTK